VGTFHPTATSAGLPKLRKFGGDNQSKAEKDEDSAPYFVSGVPI